MDRMKTKIEQTASEQEKNLVNTAIGKKKEHSGKDKKQKEELDQIKRKGRYLHIPHD